MLIKIGVGNANLKNNSATSVSLWLKKGVEARHQKNSLRSLRLCGSKKVVEKRAMLEKLAISICSKSGK